MAFAKPDRYFKRVSDIRFKEDLLDQGLDSVLLDIDNTIRSREDGRVPEDVAQWIDDAVCVGLKVCMLSNNWHANIYELSDKLGVPVVGKACKPLPGGYIVALSRIEAKARKTVLVGDQMFTDIVGAHFAGIRAYLVDPLTEKDLPYMRALRRVENVILKDMEPEARPAAADSAEDAVSQEQVDSASQDSSAAAKHEGN